VIGVVLLAAAGAGAWLWARGHRDPRQWPGELSAEWARLRGDVTAAAEAGRRAAARRESQIDQDLEEAARRAKG
jgi:hypothetical protein